MYCSLKTLHAASVQCSSVFIVKPPISENNSTANTDNETYVFISATYMIFG